MKLAIACRRISGSTGTTRGILEHARRFAALGHEVHLYGESLDVERIREAGAAPHRIPGWPWGSAFKRRLFAWLFEKAADRRFDLVVGHGDTFLQDALHLHNCVHAAHEAVHGSPLPPSSGVGRVHERMLRERRFRLLVANSRLMAQDVQERFGVPPAMVKVVYPGHDPRRFNAQDRGRLRPEARRGLGAQDGELLVGLVTSGDFKKRGVDAFIRILAALPPAQREKVRGVVAGKERDVSEYRAMARQAGLGDKVAFLEAAPAVERLYHALDVFLYPARYEEFGQAVQEAMACGVPVLTSRRVGAAELLEKENAGSVIEKPEDAAFTTALRDLLANEGARRALALAGPRACSNNTWQRNFDGTVAAYRACDLGF